MVRGLNCTVQAGGRGKYTLAYVSVNKGGDAFKRTPCVSLLPESGGAAEEAGSRRGLRLRRRAASPELLQQAVLQVSVCAEGTFCGALAVSGLTLGYLCLLLPQHGESGLLQHILQAAGEAGSVTHQGQPRPRPFPL